METTGHREDLKLARETCDELRAGNNEAILGVYQTYHPFFLGYTRRRLQSADDARASTIVDDFWVELLNAKAICSYEGLASLKTYLFGILRFRILDALRKKSRQKAYGNNVSDRGREIDGLGSDDETPEKDLLNRERIKLVHEILMVLSESSPKDAHLVKMHLEGMNYR